MEINEKLNIKICMGSSCFARGNSKNLDYIEKFIKDNNLDAKIELVGTRCENKCALGPNIVVNGKIYNKVTLDDLERICSEFMLLNKKDK